MTTADNKADDLLEKQAEPIDDAPDINELLDAYDRELMRFKPHARRTQWPTPIRKRVCTK